MDGALRTTATAIVEHALAQPPLLGGGRLISIDGRAGAGKTTLAAAVAGVAAHRVETVHVLHADDLLTGWDGLLGLGPRLRNYVVGPLASGHPARYRRYDWVLGAPAEEHVVAPMDLLVLEGVGTGHRVLRSRIATLVWVEADADLRLARGLARDGEEVRDQWLTFMEDEARYLLTQQSPSAAQVRVDAYGRLVTGREAQRDPAGSTRRTGRSR